eukprot:GHVU01196932.1.p1 GENE.GHVU01196932.1~~GHVU01196932.1.p1  ORF type:complete len:154 (-),score=17.54 GHVU01196932.1:1-462(-)
MYRIYLRAKIFVQPHDLFLKVQVEETTELPQRSDGNSWYEFLKQQLVKSAKANKENNESIVKAIGNLDDGTYGAYMRTSDSKWVHLKKAEGEITKLPITFEFLVVPIEVSQSSYGNIDSGTRHCHSPTDMDIDSGCNNNYSSARPGGLWNCQN